MSEQLFKNKEEAREFLNQLCNKNLVVQVSDGRKYSGTFLCTDNAANIVMNSCTEYAAVSDGSFANMTRHLITAVIPGLSGGHSNFHMRFYFTRRSAMSKKVFLVVSAYWIISISLVFVNKWLLSGKNTKLEAPLFITWFQCLLTAFLCYGTSYLASKAPNVVQFPRIKFSKQTAVDVLPLSIIFVSMVSFNNLCLMYLSVSFYFLARCLTTIYNVIFTYLLLHTTTSCRAIACCAAIIVGYAAGVLIEGKLGTLSLVGLLFGISSSVTCALNSIYTAKSLPKVEGSVWALTFYNNLNSMIISIPIIAILEGRNLINQLSDTDSFFWIIMIISGLMGFAIGYVCTLQIQVTSPLTHNVSGTAKAAAQTILAVVIYNETKSIPWWLSNLVVLVASAAYAYVRQTESQKHLPKLAERESGKCDNVEDDKDPLLPSKV